MSETEPDLIERLLEEFVERLRHGESPSISSYEAAYPACAEQIRNLFPAAQAMQHIALRRKGAPGLATLSARIPQSVGDYRMIREIGRGGMGVVYEAEQESLGRRVAVKVLPHSAQLDPKSLRRFEREARTAARLHHSNIIPVFGVGEEQGVHYIVMQLIRGVGLDKVICQLVQYSVGSRAIEQDTEPKASDDSTSVARALLRGDFRQAKPMSGSSETATRVPPPPVTETFAAVSARTVDKAISPKSVEEPRHLGPRYWESVARIGLQAARALQYAHGQGILHRDIKPANLLLDLQGVVWVGDFGLAKAQEQDDLSRTGDIAGTLRYMAPERFHGQVDARSDIYSLGVTLYEMLAFRAAYDDFQPSALMRRITGEPPARPRSVNPQIPADLETIVLKAIAQEPNHRYTSAQELADDLERFLDDRPIRARRVGMAERLWRWSRRNRDVAALTGLAVVLFVVIAVVMSVGYVRTAIANRRIRDALASESQQRHLAETQQHKAEAISGLTTAALDEIFELYVPGAPTASSEASPFGFLGGEIRVQVQPVLSKETAALLEHMLTYYDRLTEQEGNDSQLRRKVADANRRVGDIHGRLGHLEQARKAYLTAIEKYDQLKKESPEDATTALAIARIYNELGGLYWMARWEGEGMSFHSKAKGILETANAAAAVPPQERYELARTYYFLGRGGPPEAVPGQGRPDDDRPPPPRSEPEGDNTIAGTGVEGNKPSPPPRLRNNQESLQHAIHLLEDLITEYPTVPIYRHLLACCYRDLLPGRPEADGHPSVDPESKAIEILEKLVEDFPEVPDYRHDLSKAYARVDPRDAQFSGGHNSVVEERLRKAIRILERLIAEHPNVPDYAASEVHALYMLSEVLRRTGSQDDGENSLRTALGRQSALVAHYPKVNPYRAWKAIVEESLAKLLSDHGKLKESRTLLESAITELEQLLRSEPQATYIRDLLGRCHTNLADVLDQMGEEQQAAEVLRRGRTYSNKKQ